MCTVVVCPVVSLFCKCCVWTLRKCFCSHGATGKGQPRRKSRGSFKCQTHIRLMCEKYNQAEYTYCRHWSTELHEEDSLGFLRRLTLAVRGHFFRHPVPPSSNKQSGLARPDFTGFPGDFITSLLWLLVFCTHLIDFFLLFQIKSDI